MVCKCRDELELEGFKLGWKQSAPVETKQQVKVQKHYKQKGCFRDSRKLVQSKPRVQQAENSSEAGKSENVLAVMIFIPGIMENHFKTLNMKI